MYHRRGTYTDENAKVVAAVLGIEFIKLFAALAILHQDDLKNRKSRPSERPERA